MKMWILIYKMGIWYDLDSTKRDSLWMGRLFAPVSLVAVC